MSVLVVDDNMDLADTFALILRYKGYRVETAADGLSAIDKYRAQRYDVVLMDVYMPQMNGIEATRAIKKADPQAKIVLMTAYAEDRNMAAATNAVAYCTLCKPIDISHLVELIGEVTCPLPVLIVDDDDDFRSIFMKALQCNGYRVEAVGSGEEAVNCARHRKYRIAFVDVRLPRMDGLDTCLQLKEFDPELVVVMMTAYRDEVKDLVNKALQSAASACLYKPLNLTKVMGLVQEFVDG
ncbi:MAG TPA: response regulator [Dehalococcoidia bacterium]|nr:response regulator [Dehalococcoidia bacterium]